MLAWIPLLPLIGFLINGVSYLFHASQHAGHDHGDDGHHHGNAALVPGIIASLAIGGAFVLSAITMSNLMGMEESSRTIEQVAFSWIEFGSFQISAVLRADVLSAIFLLVITGVGTLIHVYSIGYMSHDASPAKFFAYLNLFCFAMLVLVMGGNLPILFLGWEGVGLCSYLLIGYWYTDPEKASAGKKAFIVNRIGDLGFLIGAFIIYYAFGTVDFVALNSAIQNHPEYATGGLAAIATSICLCLFLGCTGKSAQIPLYVWLPDAMAGPTPVSALIHAATMVTSGIYLIARLNKLFLLSPTAMMVVAWVGALTALLAATIAITQKDIKKVLAYSTVSQLGYMFLACGVGAFGAAVFHVMTHAFFKALLFLGAGSVIHGMHEEQDIMKMGGLKKHMPQTFAVFGVAWLAICGIPPLSGFFSKDEILWKAMSSPTGGSAALWILAAITALLTAFYMTRLFSLTFLGAERFDSKKVHVHESPLVMTGPLMVLAVLSAVGGFLGIPHASWLDHWFSPVIASSHETRAGVSASLEWVLMGFSTLVAIASIYWGLSSYKNLKTPEERRKKFSGLHQWSEDKWYVDEIYEASVVKPIHGFSVRLWRYVDVAIIDRIVVGFGRASAVLGQSMRIIQTGSIHTYALILLYGIFATLGYLIYGTKL